MSALNEEIVKLTDDNAMTVDGPMKIVGETRDFLVGVPIEMPIKGAKKDVTINCFGGPDAKAQNALMCALQDAAEAGGSNIYEFMENTPKTSFIVELYDALKALGYKIEKV